MNKNQPAFPNTQTCSYSQKCHCGKFITFDGINHHGMTLRQWYAGLAMQALISSGKGITQSFSLSLAGNVKLT